MTPPMAMMAPPMTTMAPPMTTMYLLLIEHCHRNSQGFCLGTKILQNKRKTRNSLDQGHQVNNNNNKQTIIIIITIINDELILSNNPSTHGHISPSHMIH